MLLKYAAWSILSGQRIKYPSPDIRKLSWRSENLRNGSQLLKPFIPSIQLHTRVLSRSFNSDRFSRAVPETTRMILGLLYCGYLDELKQNVLKPDDVLMVLSAINSVKSGVTTSNVDQGFRPLANSFFQTIFVNLGITNINITTTNDSTGVVTSPATEVLSQSLTQFALVRSMQRRGISLQTLGGSLGQVYSSQLFQEVNEQLDQ